MRENETSKAWVLKSWAIPKGVPRAIGPKHLAVMTEDHPVDYFLFAGTIPQGEYGAGKVLIWDSGLFYSVHKNETPEQQVAKGEIDIVLRGKKLKGRYVLIKTKWRGKKNNWLIFKVKER